MSLSESGDSSRQDFPKDSPKKITTPQFNNISDNIRQKIRPYLAIEHEEITPHPRNPEIRQMVFTGKLKARSKQIFAELSPIFEKQGYTLFMQRQQDKEQLIVVEGVLIARRFNIPWFVHLILLMITVLTTLMAGAILTGLNVDVIWEGINTGDEQILRIILRDGQRFAFPLLLILGVHEMGHYIAARLHGVKVTLPIFVPFPPFGPLRLTLGTLGAVIMIKSPFLNRRMLFDIGIAGPLAGLIVSIPIFLTGLESDPSLGIPLEWIRLLDINRVNTPPFLEFLASFVWDDKQVAQIDRSLFYRRPQALAAWFGILLTALNLLPMGQFDGGHVAYALFGRWIAWPLAMLVAAVSFSLGFTGFLGITTAWVAWMIWPIFAYLTGLRHPPPNDDITPIGWPRMIIGIITFALLLTMLVVTPFYNGLN